MKSFFFLCVALLVSSPLDAAPTRTQPSRAKPVTQASRASKKASKPTTFAPATGVASATGVGKGLSARDRRIREQQASKRQIVKTSNVSSTQMSTRKNVWPTMDLIIPELGINAPIVRGIDNEALKQGVGVDPLSSVPGQRGNSVIAGHRNVWGAWFWDLPRLKPGSQIFVKTPAATYTYKVAFTRVAQPHDTSLLEHPSDPKITRLTLYTCTKPKTECRFVVVANLVKKETAPIALPGSTLVASKTSTKVMPPVKTTVSQTTVAQSPRP